MLNASSGRPFVAFSPNGRELVASSRFEDGRGVALGFRRWTTADWAPSLEFSGAPRVELDRVELSRAGKHRAG